MCFDPEMVKLGMTKQHAAKNSFGLEVLQKSWEKFTDLIDVSNPSHAGIIELLRSIVGIIELEVIEDIHLPPLPDA